MYELATAAAAAAVCGHVVFAAAADVSKVGSVKSSKEVVLSFSLSAEPGGNRYLVAKHRPYLFPFFYHLGIVSDVPGSLTDRNVQATMAAAAAAAVARIRIQDSIYRVGASHGWRAK
jgi:hypothetical protein